jgi:hypothetical protein
LPRENFRYTLRLTAAPRTIKDRCPQHPEHLLDNLLRADLLTRLRARELPGMTPAVHYKCG